jgi:hypothetical protein
MSKIKSTPLIPTRAQVDAVPSAYGSNPNTLCANWRKGCNGVTDGPVWGRLTLCNNCHDVEQYEHTNRTGVRAGQAAADQSFHAGE